MGYTTEFKGFFVIDNIDDEFMNKFNSWAGTRRMKRDPNIVKKIYNDWNKNLIINDIGEEAEFWYSDSATYGQEQDDSILDYNSSGNQPSLWCDWLINKEKDTYFLVWDGSEKFYNYVEWLEWLIKNIFSINNCMLNGTINFQGEIDSDYGSIDIKNNVVTISNSEDM